MSMNIYFLIQNRKKKSHLQEKTFSDLFTVFGTEECQASRFHKGYMKLWTIFRSATALKKDYPVLIWQRGLTAFTFL